ncbi:MAG: hypothetical protein O4861_11370 [Trichodesmium sp. St16_bin4-tuft]|nr:hypothetical protein [Trichodesmium sp. MAG_R01]MDE5071966.1 hypothetical protein [Trichodesmium sp. St5_bin8]MDE5078316.1 hypothetical protein [Trichodesmium sp. St2_bin6]MDE5098897.1 hypothetical protein [Trichodesmium sp. St16_bin4-tuft]MDE5105001.1 hypothetical protein [Trichodesmium sp. St19_bin2]
MPQKIRKVAIASLLRLRARPSLNCCQSWTNRHFPNGLGFLSRSDRFV